MIEVPGWVLVILPISWLIGFLLAMLLKNAYEFFLDWLTDRRRSKTVTLLEVDGKFVALPKGALYVPIRLDNK